MLPGSHILMAAISFSSCIIVTERELVWRIKSCKTIIEPVANNVLTQISLSLPHSNAQINAQWSIKLTLFSAG